MSLDSNGKKRGGVFRSFSFAIAGILHSVKQERNLKIHMVIAAVVSIMGFFYRISAVEWMFILFAIGGMLSLELMNTAIERVVDLVTKDYHPLAKQAKDAAAGAVFIYAALSVVIGCIIFLPKML